jgi:hypothetical protein
MDDRVGLGTEGYSPRLLARIEYAGANECSFERAARSLGVLSELSISAKHVQRVTERLGQERRRERDAAVEAFKKGKLKPAYTQAPAVVGVHLDAGKIQLREDCGGRGVRGPHWADTKVGCFLTYAAHEGDSDPQPEPPAAFVDRRRVQRLCREMERVGGKAMEGTSSCDEEVADGFETKKERQEVGHPVRLVRTAVATMQKSEEFGWMVAAEAMRRRFYGAKARAVVGDGGNWIGPLAEMHFPGWVQVLDFLHLLAHLYAASRAAHDGYPKKAWACYQRWVRWAWGGEAAKVIEGLKRQQQRLGEAPPGAGQENPRKVVSLTLQYLENNAERMKYAEYRRAGLPITSAPVESLIKQVNQRVKGTEKFWLEGGAESVLQSRAAYLSEDDRAEQFYQRRPRGRAVGQRRRVA